MAWRGADVEEKIGSGKGVGHRGKSAAGVIGSRRRVEWTDGERWFGGGGARGVDATSRLVGLARTCPTAVSVVFGLSRVIGSLRFRSTAYVARRHGTVAGRDQLVIEAWRVLVPPWPMDNSCMAVPAR